MISVRSNSASALQDAVLAAETLATKPQLSRGEERQYNFLLAKISLLKQGFTPKEIANVESERLAREIGVTSIRSMSVDSEVEREWRDCLAGKRFCPTPIRFEVRAEDLRFERERRTNQAAGSQSISYTAGSAGGYFVPVGFYDREIASMKQYDEIFDDENCNIIESETGSPTVIPQLDDVSAASVQVGENYNSDSPGTTFKAGGTQLEAYSFRAGFLLVSIELLQDSGIPIGALLERAFAIRHARGVGQAMINGSGNASPTGLVTGAVEAGNVVVAQGAAFNNGEIFTGANSIGSQDIAAVYHALNRAYRRNAVWYMSDDTLTQQIVPLVDKSGRPLTQLQKDVYTLMGKPVAICPSMSDVAPSAYTIVLADPNYFLQRRIAAGSYLRLYNEAPGTVEAGVRAFASWYRTDSNLAVPNAQYPPCAVLQQHS